MEHWQTLLIVLLSLITLIWIGIIVTAGLIAWRLRKAIFTVSLAVRAIGTFTSQLAELSKALGKAKSELEKRAG